MHCVQGTRGRGAASRRSTVASSTWSFDKAPETATRQGYSAFQGGGLGAVLRERGVDHVYIGGLATDYCVKNAVLDALREGFGVTVVEDAMRGIDVKPGDSSGRSRRCARAGAEHGQSEDLIGG